MKRGSHSLLDRAVSDVAFPSNNSDLIILGQTNGTISLLSTKMDKFTSKIVWEKKFGDAFDISPNDDVIACGGYENHLLVINAANGDSICSIDVGSWIWCVLFLSQQKIACALWGGTVVIVCWQTQKIEKIMKGFERPVSMLAISPVNCDILLTGYHVGVIHQTIISSDKTVMNYEGHTGNVKDLRFLSCGNMFVSASADRTARLFALDQKQAIRVFKGHADSVSSVSLIHGDEFLITSSYDDTVKVWKIESGKCLSTWVSVPEIWCGRVSKDGQTLVVGGKEHVTFLSFPSFSLDHSCMLTFSE